MWEVNVIELVGHELYSKTLAKNINLHKTAGQILVFCLLFILLQNNVEFETKKF